jgi:hypothetical protein
MFWKIVGTIGAGSFILGGVDILTTEGCGSVDFGGSGRSSTYTCTFGEYQGELSAGAASSLMILGGLAVLVFAWIPRKRRRDDDY